MPSIANYKMPHKTFCDRRLIFIATYIDSYSAIYRQPPLSLVLAPINLVGIAGLFSSIVSYDLA